MGSIKILHESPCKTEPAMEDIKSLYYVTDSI